MQSIVTVPVQTWSDGVRTSVAGAMAPAFAVIPRLIGFVAILVVGWLVASLLGKAASALLHAVKFNELANRSGFTSFVQKMDVETDAAGVLASVIKWFIRLIAMVVAFDALGLPAVSDVLRQLLLWLPNVVVALIVLVVGGLGATALANVVRGATAQSGFRNADMLAAVARVSVWAFAIIVAVNQVGIATTLVNTLLIGVVSAVALASGLAFGLGGRDKAAELIASWSSDAAAIKPTLEHAADAIGKD